MLAGRIAGRNSSDGIDLQIKFSFTVTLLVPLRGNSANLQPLGCLRRGSSLKRGPALV